jgi:predicted deacylase
MNATVNVPRNPPSPITIGAASVAPGSKAILDLPLTELSDGTIIRLPVVVINGAKPGPRLYVGAAIHGDEVAGVAIITGVLKDIEPHALSGSIIAVPVQHPLAFHADHRIPVSQFIKSPLDQAPVDAWTCFPGDAEGNLSQQLAAKLFGLIKMCSFALDIHTPTRGGRYVPISILPGPALGDNSKKALWLAEQCDSGFIVLGEQGMYVNRGILCVEATAAGVPSFTFEIGEGGRLEPEVIVEGVRCVRNGLIGLGMIGGARVAPKANYVMRDFLGIRARRGGLLFTLEKLGVRVEKGQPLARTVDIYGRDVETFTAPQEGVFVRSTTLSTVSTGERVATLGVF